MPSKPHYLVLDGLRGTAALCVVLFHFCEAIYPDYKINPLGHGFLAVDFFYCLSGFVIAYAYDNRVGKMKVSEFFKKRLIRLHPLVIIGSMLGFLVYSYSILKGTVPGSEINHTGIAFIFSVLLIPTTIALPHRFGAVFPFNAPAWSLFLEYLANIFYILVLWRMTRKWITGLLVIAAILLCYVSARSGTLLGGWNATTFWDGGARIFYSFLVGLLIYRYQLIIKSRLGYIFLSLLLVGVFMMPYFSWNWIMEAGLVIIILPLIIIFGAGAVVTGRLERICTFMGRISYPLYMTHAWFMWPFGTWYRRVHPAGWRLLLVVAPCTLFLIGFAYVIMLFYDEPLRARLSGHPRPSVLAKIFLRP